MAIEATPTAGSNGGGCGSGTVFPSCRTWNGPSGFPPEGSTFQSILSVPGHRKGWRKRASSASIGLADGPLSGAPPAPTTGVIIGGRVAAT